MNNNNATYNRRKHLYRIKFGINQMINHPLLNLIWILYIVLSILFVVAVNRLEIMTEVVVPIAIAKNIILITIRIATVLLIILSVIAILSIVGEIYARKDEMNVNLALSGKKNVTEFPPILIKKKHLKYTTVTEREFYSSTPLSDWEDRQEAICDRLNVHMVGKMQYGGKKHNNGNLIYFMSASDRIPEYKGEIVDDEF